jgi:hypothetical protein
MGDLQSFHRLLPPPTPDVIKYLRNQGITIDALCEPELPAFAEVVFHADLPFFDFIADVGDDGAVQALIFLARDELGLPLDLIAWSAKQNKLAAWDGNAAMLGTESVFGPRLDPERALPVHQTPLEWLVQGRHGVVIVNPLRAAPILLRGEPLKVPTRAFGRYIGALINLRPPRILTPTVAVQRAVA